MELPDDNSIIFSQIMSRSFTQLVVRVDKIVKADPNVIRVDFDAEEDDGRKYWTCKVYFKVEKNE